MKRSSESRHRDDEYYRIVSVKPVPGFRLEVVFKDGLTGEVCLEDQLFGPVFEPLRDEAYFNQVRVDEFGALCWPNGADLAPDGLYEDISKRNDAGRTTPSH